MCLTLLSKPLGIVRYLRILSGVLLVAISILAEPTLAQQARWQRLPIPTSLDLHTVHFSSRTHGIVIAHDSLCSVTVVYRTTDGGAAWDSTKIAGCAYTQVSFVDAKRGYATAGQFLFTTTDGGFNWSMIHDARDSLVDVSFSSTLGLIATKNRSYWSTDEGEYWNALSDRGFTSPIIAIGAYDRATGSLLTQDSVFAVYNLARWRPEKSRYSIPAQDYATSPTYGHIYLIDPDIRAVFDPYELRYRDKDGKRVLAIGFATNDVHYAALTGGRVVKSIDQFKYTHAIQDLPVREDFNSICFVDSMFGVVAGNRGMLFSTMQLPTTLDTSTWVDTLHGVIDPPFEGIVTDTGTKEWKRLPLATKYHLKQVHFRDELNGVVIGWGYSGRNSLIFKTTDGGNTWETMMNLSPISHRKWVFQSADSGYMIAGTTLYRTIDGGLNWAAVREFEGLQLADVSFWSPMLGYIATSDPSVTYRTTDGGKTWDGLPVACTAIGAYVDYAVALSGNRIMASYDRGSSWKAEVTGVPENARFSNNYRTGHTYWITPGIHAVFGGYQLRFMPPDSVITSIGYATSVRHYATGLVGKIYASEQQFSDNVRTQQTTSLYTMNDISFATPKVGYAVGDHGYLYKTVIGSATVRHRDQSNLKARIGRNPFKESTTLTIDADDTEMIEVLMLDLLGRQIYRETVQVDGSTNIELRPPAAGVYFLRIVGRDHTEQLRLVRE